jgi:hypothetical protein
VCFGFFVLFVENKIKIHYKTEVIGCVKSIKRENKVIREIQISDLSKKRIKVSDFSKKRIRVSDFSKRNYNIGHVENKNVMKRLAYATLYGPFWFMSDSRRG